MITLRDFRATRAGNTCLPPVNIALNQGDILVLMGRSGVGKTTLLDALRGDLDHKGHIALPPKIHSVYQGDNQLLPWRTVAQNFDLAKADSAWKQMAAKWQLADLLDRWPTDISGGQRQRFVLLRSIYRGADLLLCDEPLNHLDSFTAYRIAEDFRGLVKNKGIAVIWVTHNISEAAILADQCYMLTSNNLIKIDQQDIRYDHVRQYLSN